MAELPVAVIGVDHHRTPVAVRERLAVGPAQVPELARRLAALPGCREAVVVSTCNRLECYLGGQPAEADALAAVAAIGGLCPEQLAGHAYWRRGEPCIRHLFRVAGGLESLVLGEYQIIAQVRGAYEAARALGLTGPGLNPLFQRALAVAKEVRNRTALGRHKMSIASVAVDLARHVHGDLAAARLLVVGAGEMAELAVRYLLDQGVGQGAGRIGIVNRSSERAMALAELAGAPVYPWSDLRSALAAHDIVVSSTAAPHLVLMAEDVRAAMTQRRGPLVLIDLAVPRDIDAQAGELDDVYLYNIDHLEGVVAANRQLRVEEVEAAEAVVDEHVRDHCLNLRPGRGELLAEVAAWFEAQVQAEGAQADEAARRALHRLGGKLQHRVMAWLRDHPDDPEAERTVRELLDLGRG